MKDIDREISKVYNYNYADKFDIEDNEQRRIYLNCEIDESIVDSAVYHILRYNLTKIFLLRIEYLLRFT